MMSKTSLKPFGGTQSGRGRPVTLLFLGFFLFSGCQHQTILSPPPAPQPDAPSLSLSAQSGEFRLKVTASSKRDYVVRLYPSDITYILKDSENNIVSHNPGYKRSPPDDADWRLLKRRTVLLLPISPAADYSALEDGKYVLKAKLNPAGSIPATLKQRFKSYSVWSGLPQESNEIEISVKDGRWQ